MAEGLAGGRDPSVKPDDVTEGRPDHRPWDLQLGSPATPSWEANMSHDPA
jgi:hypothetical protein